MVVGRRYLDALFLVELWSAHHLSGHRLWGLKSQESGHYRAWVMKEHRAAVDRGVREYLLILSASDCSPEMAVRENYEVVVGRMAPELVGLRRMASSSSVMASWNSPHSLQILPRS